MRIEKEWKEKMRESQNEEERERGKKRTFRANTKKFSIPVSRNFALAVVQIRERPPLRKKPEY